MSKILIIEARFYEEIADMLAEGAIAVLEEQGFAYDRITVPGCFEIPAAIAFAARKYDGFVALGCVIRGETTHYDYVCAESARGINDLAIQQKLAIGYGIITAENRQQALARADKKGKKNVGGRTAAACLAMVELKKKFGS